MEPTTSEKILWFLTALGWAMALLGAVGEYLGWWNDVGHILMAGGTILGVLMAAASLSTSAGRDQVDLLQDGVDTTHGKLGSMDAKLGKLDTMDAKLDTLEAMDAKLGKLDTMDAKLDKLDTMDAKLDTLDAMDTKLGKLDKLDAIQQAITGERGVVHELDVVQVELDRQTGVLDTQLTVLREIRDSL